MKKLNNKLTIVTLFFMICNFFIVPIANVFAESSTAVDDYISDMNSKSNAIDSNFISSKNSLTYINNSSFKYAVDSFYNEYNLFKNNYDSYINNIGDSISVRKVLVDSNSPLYFNNMLCHFRYLFLMNKGPFSILSIFLDDSTISVQK